MADYKETSVPWAYQQALEGSISITRDHILLSEELLSNDTEVRALAVRKLKFLDNATPVLFLWLYRHQWEVEGYPTLKGDEEVDSIYPLIGDLLIISSYDTTKQSNWRELVLYPVIEDISDHKLEEYIGFILSENLWVREFGLMCLHAIGKDARPAFEDVVKSLNQPLGRAYEQIGGLWDLDQSVRPPEFYQAFILGNIADDVLLETYVDGFLNQSTNIRERVAYGHALSFNGEDIGEYAVMIYEGMDDESYAIREVVLRILWAIDPKSNITREALVRGKSDVEGVRLTAQYLLEKLDEMQENLLQGKN